MGLLPFIATLCALALTAPLPDEKEYLAWNAGPSTRGTWSLLLSCVLTLILCLHSGPSQRTSTWNNEEGSELEFGEIGMHWYFCTRGHRLCGDHTMDGS